MKKVEWLPPVVIPNTSNTVLVQFFLFKDDDGSEVPEHSYHPIIAWHIKATEDGDTSFAEPIIADAMCTDPIYCLEEHVGDHTRTWRFVHDCSFGSFEEARAYATEQFREREKIQEEYRAKHTALMTKAREVCLAHLANNTNTLFFNEPALSQALRAAGVRDSDVRAWITRARQKWDQELRAALHPPEERQG